MVRNVAAGDSHYGRRLFNLAIDCWLIPFSFVAFSPCSSPFAFILRTMRLLLSVFLSFAFSFSLPYSRPLCVSRSHPTPPLTHTLRRFEGRDDVRERNEQAQIYLSSSSCYSNSSSNTNSTSSNSSTFTQRSKTRPACTHARRRYPAAAAAVPDSTGDNHTCLLPLLPTPPPPSPFSFCPTPCACGTRARACGPARHAQSPALRVQDSLSFDDLAAWYTEEGYKVSPWLELLDLNKWAVGAANPVTNGGFAG